MILSQQYKPNYITTENKENNKKKIQVLDVLKVISAFFYINSQTK